MRVKLVQPSRSFVPLLVKLYAPAFGLLVFTVWLSTQAHIPISEFTRDPTAILQVGPFLGLLSNIGVLFWCAAAAICFFSGLVLRTRTVTDEMPAFFLVSGWLTFVLLADDLFRFHDFVIPTYLRIQQEVTYIAYSVLVALYFTKFRASILRARCLLLLMLALIFFGLSIAADVVLEGWLPWSWHFLVEDGAKLLGIVSWFGYFACTCYQAMAASDGGMGEA